MRNHNPAGHQHTALPPALITKWGGQRARIAACSLLVLVLLLTAMLLLAGCSGLPFLGGPATGTPGADTAPGDTPAPGSLTATPTTALAGVPTITATPGSREPLLVWLPPQFDPAGSDPAAALLRDRLDAFTRETGLAVSARVKAAGGPGGLMDSLTATAAAAPQALPDLIALPRADLEAGALKGLLYPFAASLDESADADWYAFARQMAGVQGATFGIPFAGDALALLSRPGRASPAPATWDEFFTQKDLFIFTAADPQALFTLTLYATAGGTLQGEQGRPALDSAALTRALQLYETGMHDGKLQPWLTQYENDAQAWQAYSEGRANWIVTWASRYLGELPADTSLQPLPSLDGRSLTLANGWVWALASADIQRRAAAEQLALYLTQADFMAQWSAAAGLLPARPSALAGWSNQSLQSALSPLALSAQLRPSTDQLAGLGPVLRDAVTSVIRGQNDSAQAAQQAADKLRGP